VTRFLERMGIWSYCGKGGVTVEFDDGTPTAYLAPIGGTPNKAAGHAWVVAPPFVVVDATIQRQNWSARALPSMPKYVAVEDAARTTAGAQDWLDPDLYAATSYSLGREPTMKDVRERATPAHVDGATRLGIWLVKAKGVRIRYLTTGIGAPLEPLEEIRSLKLSGRWGLELWRDFEKF
jgi:hypothetical protein